ncbi:hypothetical protein Rrhod_3985 [Rhodococcus rhodnii LMG 5362]|uniref:Uncharacterized protein n=1 Tax=Rhodococcus rhodnii LMG 5362 TaxID=1273125 RepID=R7WHK0_9NOCA|nr:hypothetical protein Rrhod_3985 [Rhodococcus rhodnii LMG 5362]
MIVPPNAVPDGLATAAPAPLCRFPPGASAD